MNPEEVIRFEDVTLGYQTRIALRGLSFSISRGEFLGVIGPNGSGKSTLLKAILGILRPFQGHIWVLGKVDGAIRTQRHRIGYLPQREEIDPSFPATVMDVVLMGRYSRLGLLRRPGRRDREAVLRCLEAVDMLQLADEPFAHLSGGQQQRVLMARALVKEPEILLLDEPTTAIDVAHQEAIVNIIRRIHQTRGLTIIMVTHDVNLISPWVDRLAYLNRRLYALGKPDEVLNEDLLSRVYRARVGIFREDDGKIRVITGDHHA